MGTGADEHELVGAGDPWPRRIDLNRFFRWLFLLVVVVYAIGINDQWRFQRDSALYLGLARSLAENGEFSFNYHPHTYVWPGFPAVLSLVYMTVGENFLVMNVIVSVMGLACIAMGWLLLRELPIEDWQAAACILLFGMSRTLFYYSAHVMTEVPFTLLVLIALYCGLRVLRAAGPSGWLWCIGAAAATTAAQFVRPSALALLIALLVTVWARRPTRRRLMESMGRLLIILAPYVVTGALWCHRCGMVAHQAGATATGYFDRFVARRGLGIVTRVLSRIPELAEAVPDVAFGVGMGLVVGALLLALAVLGAVRLVRRGDRLLLPYAALCVGATCLGSPGRRYLVPVLLPLYCWIILGLDAAIMRLGKAGGRGPTPGVRRAIMYGFVALAVGLNVARIGCVIHENRAPDFNAAQARGRLGQYLDLTDHLAGTTSPERDVVVAREDRIVHHFSRARVQTVPSRVSWKSVREGRMVGRMKELAETWTVYMVYDPDKDGTIVARGKRQPGPGLTAYLMAENPEAFELVRRFGSLELLRVHTDRLKEEVVK